MIEIYNNPKQLPDTWDTAAKDNYALKKDYLIHLHEYNPCKQTYVILDKGEISSILVYYELNMNIFTYSKLKLNIPITIIGIPCSVCEKGYSLSSKDTDEIGDYIKSIKGAKIILNAESSLDLKGFAKGHTLPACIMDVKWDSFDEYLSKLRSHYRYRYKKAFKKLDAISIKALNSSDFNFEHYSLYEQVYDKSQFKLEKLSFEFFKNAGENIMEFSLSNTPVAFIQYKIVGREMVFLFGGMDYALNKEYDLYINMLLYIVRLAIENNCTHINFGQTAEEIKCRLGAFREYKYMYIHHSNPFLNKAVSLLQDLFCYKLKDIRLKVLKV
ncbi:hypothetical protein OXPF_19130 [Oxobacter pfennigii]|uniref:Uncharacterized protein n=1 Tax=Oxobacter pfennigii TaxID=36849 RepID=A0A0P8WAS6_9CLOT|nr:GNAT family N-acetyltransferase [Oxobacter pfennigii]KPU44827.1 hypothetical protein OXPF_19130 [Oxobacter pfennigii]